MLKKKKKFTLNGTQVMSEEWTVGSVQHLMIYVYDAEGSPAGFRYRNSTYNEGEFKNYIWTGMELHKRVKCGIICIR